MSFVYFIHANSSSGYRYSGYIKIGVAADPVARLAAMQTGSPLDLELIGQVPGDTALETRLHRYFAKQHVRGEWFENDSDTMRTVEAIVQGGSDVVEFVLDQRHWTLKFRSFLAMRGISLDDFAVDTGIKPQTMERIFAGRAHPTRKTRDAIIAFTGRLVCFEDFERAAPSSSLSVVKEPAA